jgi:hypothetical protein
MPTIFSEQQHSFFTGNETHDLPDADQSEHKLNDAREEHGSEMRWLLE